MAIFCGEILPGLFVIGFKLFTFKLGKFCIRRVFCDLITSSMFFETCGSGGFVICVDFLSKRKELILILSCIEKLNLGCFNIILYIFTLNIQSLINSFQMDEPVYIIDHMIVMGIDVENASFPIKKVESFNNFLYFFKNLKIFLIQK